MQAIPGPALIAFTLPSLTFPLFSFSFRLPLLPLCIPAAPLIFTLTLQRFMLALAAFPFFRSALSLPFSAALFLLNRALPRLICLLFKLSFPLSSVAFCLLLLPFELAAAALFLDALLPVFALAAVPIPLPRGEFSLPLLLAPFLFDRTLAKFAVSLSSFPFRLLLELAPAALFFLATLFGFPLQPAPLSLLSPQLSIPLPLMPFIFDDALIEFALFGPSIPIGPLLELVPTTLLPALLVPCFALASPPLLFGSSQISFGLFLPLRLLLAPCFVIALLALAFTLVDIRLLLSWMGGPLFSCWASAVVRMSTYLAEDLPRLLSPFRLG
jgi:hypothetical protein